MCVCVWERERVPKDWYCRKGVNSEWGERVVKERIRENGDGHMISRSCAREEEGAVSFYPSTARELRKTTKVDPPKKKKRKKEQKK